MRKKDSGLLCLFCSYGMAQAAADAVTCCRFLADAVKADSTRDRVDSGALSCYYLVQGIIHLAVFYMGNKLYNNRGYIDGAGTVVPFAQQRHNGPTWTPIAISSPAAEIVATARVLPDEPKDDDDDDDRPPEDDVEEPGDRDDDVDRSPRPNEQVIPLTVLGVITGAPNAVHMPPVVKG